jgi:hypothetical protein
MAAPRGPENNRYVPVILVTGHTRGSQIFQDPRRGSQLHVVASRSRPRFCWSGSSGWRARSGRSSSATPIIGPDRRFKHEGPPIGDGRASPDDLPAKWATRKTPNMSDDEIANLMKAQRRCRYDRPQIPPAQPPGAMVKDRGGLMAKDAIAAAEAGVESCARARMAELDEHLAEIERRFGKAGPDRAKRDPSRPCTPGLRSSTSALRRRRGVDKAAMSLCRLADSCAEPGVWRWDAIDVHLNAMRCSEHGRGAAGRAARRRCWRASTRSAIGPIDDA